MAAIILMLDRRYVSRLTKNVLAYFIFFSKSSVIMVGTSPEQLHRTFENLGRLLSYLNSISLANSRQMSFVPTIKEGH